MFTTGQHTRGAAAGLPSYSGEAEAIGYRERMAEAALKDSPAVEQPVQSALRQQAQGLMALGELVQRLNERLHPVLGLPNQAGHGGNVGPTPVANSISGQIRDHNQGIAMISENIASLLGRLEL